MGGTPVRGHDPAVDRAAVLLRELQTHWTEQPQVAEPTERLAARLFDSGAWLVLTFAWSLVAVALDRFFFPDPVSAGGSRLEQIEPLISWLTSVGLVASLVALEAVPAAYGARSLSKRRFNLRILGPSGEPAEWWRAAVRMLWLLPGCAGLALWGYSAGSGSPLAWIGIGLEVVALAIPATMFFSDDHRGLHDRIAGTRVVSDR